MLGVAINALLRSRPGNQRLGGRFPGHDRMKMRKIGLRAGDVRLTLVPRRRVGVELELWAIEKDCVYFREVFGGELSTAAA